ncbi:GNAT family N-acetyltransferase [Achromobacter xylosoxidans]
MSDHPVTLRQATARDADAIAAMHAASWAATYRGLLPDGFLDAGLADDRMVHWQDRMRESNLDARAVFIAEQDGQPIGFVCVQQEHDHPGEVLLDNLHVLPPYQGTGAGKLMVARAEPGPAPVAPRACTFTRWKAIPAPSPSMNARAGNTPAARSTASAASRRGRGAMSGRSSAESPRSGVRYRVEIPIAPACHRVPPAGIRTP